MIQLHAIWHDHRLHLWGESSASAEAAAPLASPAMGPGDHPEGPGDHPGALDCAALHAVMGELSADGLLASIAEESGLTLWLPTRHGRVLSSHDPGVQGVQDEVELAVWRVPTLALIPADAIDFLSSLDHPLPVAGADPAGADSLRFWSRLGRYVLSLLARRQFVPDLEPNGGRGADGGGAPRANWRVVVPDTDELGWLQQVAGAMPPVCRAVAPAGPRVPDAVEVVEDFLHTCADAVIRRLLTEDEFFHQIHERATGDAPLEVRWLAALMAEVRELPVPADALLDFHNHLRAWIGRIDGDEAIPTRIAFCLRSPDEPFGDPDEGPDASAPGPDGDLPPADREAAPAGHWRVDLLLQTLDASETLHDLAEIWADSGANPGVLRRNLANRREHLLAELERAVEVFPQLQDALSGGAPTSVFLSAVNAHAFIRDCAPLLEARGFAVLLPDWARQSRRRLGLRLHVQPAGSVAGVSGAGRLGLGSLVDFEWRVAVGDAELSQEDFERMRVQRAPLVRLHGEWIALDPDAIDAAADFLEAQRSGRMTLGQAIRATAGAEELEAGLPVVGIEGAAWIEQLLRTAGTLTVDGMDQPASFLGELRPYQQRGLEWLAFMQRIGIGACLADDMGLGKTIQLIALLLAEREAESAFDGDAAPGPTLIFAPMTVVGNWRRELERFAPRLRVMVHHGTERLSGDAFVAEAAACDVVVTTYALGHRDQEILERVAWRRIVLDEAQKIKNPAAAQTIAIRKLPSTYRVALTGTPLENHLSELWSIMEMLNPGLLGSAARFRKRFAVPIERMGDRQRAEQLRGLIRPFVLRRVKDDPDVSCDLPEKMEMQVFCNLTPEQAALYEQVVGTTLSEVESASGIRRRGVILAALTRLKQICNHPVQYLRDASPLDGRSGKCERLVEMLEEVIAEGDAALVFTQFREMGDLLVRVLTERLHTEVLFLHGSTTAKARQKMIDRFQDPASGVRIFLLSLRAGGLGLNLTAANHVFHFDRWWNPAVEAQATDRAYRIGQTRRVQVHKFVCMGTIEDRIDRMLTEKLALADQIVGSGDEWLTGLSTEELRACLSLSRDAVGEVADGR
jgi:hypothetical protein